MRSIPGVAVAVLTLLTVEASAGESGPLGAIEGLLACAKEKEAREICIGRHLHPDVSARQRERILLWLAANGGKRVAAPCTPRQRLVLRAAGYGATSSFCLGDREGDWGFFNYIREGGHLYITRLKDRL